MYLMLFYCRVSLEGQIRRRGEENPAGPGDPAGPTAGRNGRAVHVPKHQSFQIATTR